MYRVAIKIDDVNNVDHSALKYVILYMNTIQTEFEFLFLDKNPILNDEHQIEINANIEITDRSLEGNLFFWQKDGEAKITTIGWDQKYSPPSVFEYLIHCIICSVIFMIGNDKIKSHNETLGCQLDFTRIKSDDRVDIALGHFCSLHRKQISEVVDRGKFEALEKLASLEWLGVKTPGEGASYGMHHYFGIDLHRDSGLKLHFLQRVLKRMEDLPFEMMKEIIKLVVAIVLAWALINLGLKVQ